MPWRQLWEQDITHKWPHRDITILTSHNHGSSPEIENLATYLEFNAMFCVAAEWISTKPTIESDWVDDGWEAWLDGWDLEMPNTWAADKRQRTPMEPAFWIASTTNDWDQIPTDSDYDSAIGLIDPLHKDFLVADASLYRYAYRENENIRINSALVSPQTARSLLYALHSSRHPYDYRVPCVGDELEIDEKIVNEQFKFKGWIEEKVSDTEGFDQYDLYRYQLKNITKQPGTMFLQDMRLVCTDGMGHVFRSRTSGNPVTIYEHWNDCRRGRQYEYEFHTEGNRLWINIEEMLAFLQKCSYSLLLKCEIKRHLYDADSSRSRDEYEINTKLYLVDTNGDIESIARCYRFGETDL